MDKAADIGFMTRAIELAKKAWSKTHPNPMVGAVIVRDGRIIGEGYHHADGMPHAEINALQSLTESAHGATMYVTLEPCSTKGRTGACSDAILKNGIARVVIGSLDPNPLHAGRAVKIFKHNGIECEYGILEKECFDLNFIFNYAIVRKEAMIALKVARTKNGKIAETAGIPSKITGKEARMHAMRYRELFPAIGVGLGTVIADNPSLTRRLNGDENSGMRLIFDRSLNCADLDMENYKVFSDGFAHKTHVVCDAEAISERMEILGLKGVNIIRLRSVRTDDKAFWSELKKSLYQTGITGLIVEGGAKVLSSLARTREAAYMFEYTSPKVYPECALDAFQCGTPEIEAPFADSLGHDCCLRGPIKYRD